MTNKRMRKITQPSLWEVFELFLDAFADMKFLMAVINPMRYYSREGLYITDGGSLLGVKIIPANSIVDLFFQQDKALTVQERLGREGFKGGNVEAIPTTIFFMPTGTKVTVVGTGDAKLPTVRVHESPAEIEEILAHWEKGGS